ncbi:hypothetical protein C9374_001453 [Naegleria lovaniensis]|uniref:Peptidase S8/S53 domain-containing protein n=1 Tax=Naegleria lovaniensis TaxID=51637 RepID=A0AA88GY83_NAELO|nr:uncharacterized protein C9374_001453 [Naegleria lovaniensis]KAG2387859.1 hypothetical protein C9374_001453 [Naegleria lovaniensis]
MSSSSPRHLFVLTLVALFFAVTLLITKDQQHLVVSHLLTTDSAPNLLTASTTDESYNSNNNDHQSLLVHVKLLDHVLMTHSILETLASLMRVESFRQDFQFSSTESSIFTTRLTKHFIQTHLSNDPFIQSHVEWIKQVPNEYKLTFPQLTLESLKLHGEVKIIYDRKMTSVERMNRLLTMKEWFHTRLQHTLTQELLSLNMEQVFSSMKRFNIREYFRFQNEIPQEWFRNDISVQDSSHGRTGEESAVDNGVDNDGSSSSNDDFIHPVHQVKAWLENKLTEFFNLKFDLNLDGHLHISLSNFNAQVWDRLERAEFSHESVQLLSRREDLQRFMNSIPELSHLWDSISNQMGSQLLDQLLADPSVNYITRTTRIGLDNLEINKMVQNGGGNNNTYFWNHGITGEGEVLAFTDTGIDPNHCFFSGVNESYVNVNMTNRKIVYIDIQGGLGDYADNHGHGTHVAGTLAGIPSNFTPSVNNEIGVAIGAKLYVVDGDKTSGLISFSSISTYLRNAFNRAKSCISSNSWGCNPKYSCSFDCVCQQTLANGTKVPISNDECLASIGRRCCEFCNKYDFYGYDLDNYLGTVNDQVTFFGSAGNSASMALLGTIGGSAPSKNGVAVGSMYSKDTMSSFSSRGPTVDGRIKPDIVTPGDGIASALTKTSCSLTSKSGTSMACPAAAGAAGLVRHYFNKNNQQKLKELEIGNKTVTGLTLSGTLVKAMMIHSGEQMIGSAANLGYPMSQLPVPNNFFGFGRVNLQNVLKIDADPFSVNKIGNLSIVNRMYLDVLDSVKFQFQATRMTNVKVTITWYDLPSSLSEKEAVKKLINDLDLLVTVQNSTTSVLKTFYGNLELTNNSAHDSVNTVESVTVNAIPSGSFVNISVTAKSTNKGKQAFSMVVTGGIYLIQPSSTSVITPPPQLLLPHLNHNPFNQVPNQKFLPLNRQTQNQVHKELKTRSK